MQSTKYSKDNSTRQNDEKLVLYILHCAKHQASVMRHTMTWLAEHDPTKVLTVSKCNEYCRNIYVYYIIRDTIENESSKCINAYGDDERRWFRCRRCFCFLPLFFSPDQRPLALLLEVFGQSKTYAASSAPMTAVSADNDIEVPKRGTESPSGGASVSSNTQCSHLWYHPNRMSE
jgi:hypothetical protein